MTPVVLDGIESAPERPVGDPDVSRRVDAGTDRPEHFGPVEGVDVVVDHDDESVHVDVLRHLTRDLADLDGVTGIPLVDRNDHPQSRASRGVAPNALHSGDAEVLEGVPDVARADRTAVVNLLAGGLRGRGAGEDRVVAVEDALDVDD